MDSQELKKKFDDYKNIKNYKDALAAVKQNGDTLQRVADQTIEMCLAAVNKDGNVLQHVVDQTPEICLAAVNQNGNALRYVADQTIEICLAAVNQNGFALKYVKTHIFDGMITELTVAEISERLGFEVKIVK